MADGKIKVGTATVVVTQLDGGALNFDVSFDGEWNGFMYHTMTRYLAKGYRAYQAEKRRKGEDKWEQKSETSSEPVVQQPQQPVTAAKPLQGLKPLAGK